MGAHWNLPQLAAYGAALILTLALASRLTPRHWWRRPNLRALGVLAGGTLAFGALFCVLFGVGPEHASTALAQAAPAAGAGTPPAGARYRVVDALNLRSANGVRAARVDVIPAGTLVTATGAADGDWWQVRAQVAGQEREGWASSLWLRRADEGRVR